MNARCDRAETSEILQLASDQRSVCDTAADSLAECYGTSARFTPRRAATFANFRLRPSERKGDARN
jgi:hypothetical protein